MATSARSWAGCCVRREQSSQKHEASAPEVKSRQGGVTDHSNSPYRVASINVLPSGTGACNRLIKDVVTSKEKSSDVCESFRKGFQSEMLKEPIKDRMELGARMNALCGEMGLRVPAITEGNVNDVLQGLADGSYPLKDTPSGDNLEKESTPKSKARGTQKEAPKKAKKRDKKRASGGVPAQKKEAKPGKTGVERPAKPVITGVEQPRDRPASLDVIDVEMKDAEADEISVVERDSSPERGKAGLRPADDQILQILKELRTDMKETQARVTRMETKSSGTTDAAAELVRRSGGLLQDSRAKTKATKRSFTKTQGTQPLSLTTDSKKKRKPVVFVREEIPTQSQAEAFWEERAKRPFPAVTIADERNGSSMLMNALRHHETFTAFCNSTIAGWRSKRNSSEMLTLARALDALFHEIGPEAAKGSLSAEILIRRMSAVMSAEMTGNWDFAQEIEGATVEDLLSHEQRQTYRQRTKLRNQLAGQGAKDDSENKLEKDSKQDKKPASRRGRGGDD